MQEDLDKISNWLTTIKLTLNTEKTNYMLITSILALPMNTNFTLNISNKSLNRVSSFKYLGITIHDKLKWNTHINSACRKVIGFSSVVKRLGKQILPTTKISVYYSMIHSHLSYLSPVWGTSATKRDLDTLQVAQNEAVRKIFVKEYQNDNISTEDIRKNTTSSTYAN